MSLTVKNKLFQPILINIKGRTEPLTLASRGSETVSAREMESNELKSLVASGDIKVVQGGKVKETTEKKEGGKGK